ncbi:MAG: helix-turn-helix domain-containing protein [Pseudomonadota bacterium]
MDLKEDKIRTRDPEKTRKLIIDAAKELIAQEGSESLSVSRVAQMAGVNRGTAYLHFKNREELLSHTIATVREDLVHAIRSAVADIENWSPEDDSVMERISRTLNNNARLARIWLSELVLSDDKDEDVLWKVWREALSAMRAAHQLADDVDEDVLAVIGLTATFVWPIISRAETMSEAQNKRSAKRYAQAFDRIILHGVLKR